ncbi:MAG: 3D domain-containing protein [Myxococcales bacterium]|nr:3D domain-containing protein [Myxococcales bacterium]
MEPSAEPVAEPAAESIAELSSEPVTEPVAGPAAEPARAGSGRGPRRLASMWNTYYVLSEESDFRGPQSTPLYDVSCGRIGQVRAAFYQDLCIQGSGLLEDGRLVNYGRRCTRSCPAAPICRGRDVRVCYLVLDARFPHGMGAGVPLVPARSVAVDPRRIPLGSWLYLEELDGVRIPGSGHLHDGCVRAEDTGGGIRGDHFDLFAGRRAQWRRWEQILPTRSRFTVWLEHPRCRGRGGPPIQLPPFDRLPTLEGGGRGERPAREAGPSFAERDGPR